MTIKNIKYELQNIICGKLKVSNGESIQSVASYLKRSKRTSRTSAQGNLYKQKEKEIIIDYCNKNDFFVQNIDFDKFISSGAEQKVYLKDEYSVIKLNDSIYFESWKDYLNNLLLNNYFFPETAYKLLGFYIQEDVMYAVVEQNFIKSDKPTNLNLVKDFMLTNGFENTRNHDYYNDDLGIILEDLHDENVLTNNNILYFIDTVFYIKDKFWNN